MTLSVAQTSAAVLTVQQVIDAIFTIGKAADPDTAMAIAYSQGLALGTRNPELAETLATAIHQVIGNPNAREDGQELMAQQTAGFYELFLAAASASVEANPDLAAAVETELSGR